MHAIQTILTERVDDIPLLLNQMQQMALPALIDRHVPAHGNWQGRSLGWVSTIGLSSIVSRGDHRLVHVEPWVASRRFTFCSVTGQSVERTDVTDDRLERVLRHLRDDTRWMPCEHALTQHTLRVYDLSCQRVHVESTTASAHSLVSEGGLVPFGHRKEHRPALPQVKVMQAVRDPLGRPLATDVVSGERAEDPLYVPCMQRVQDSVGRCGLLFVGDCKMAAREPRAFIASRGDVYWCPLPHIQLAEDELEEAIEAISTGAHVLLPVLRASASADGPALIAEGCARPVSRQVEVAGKPQHWPERRLVLRSIGHAKAAETALRARVATAQAQVEALHQRGRGRKRCAEIDDFRQVVVEVVQRHQVEECLWLRDDQRTTRQRIRAYRGRPAGVQEERQASVEGRVDETALEAAIRRLGWRISSTKQPPQQWSLEQAVVAYRHQYQVERRLGRLKGRPLSVTPMSVPRDDHATGLIRLVSIALRVLTLLEFVGRRQLAAQGNALGGL